MDLPDEVILRICGYLSPVDIIRLTQVRLFVLPSSLTFVHVSTSPQVARELRGVTSDSYLWARFYAALQSVPHGRGLTSSYPYAKDWKSLYKHELLKRRKRPSTPAVREMYRLNGF